MGRSARQLIRSTSGGLGVVPANTRILACRFAVAQITHGVCFGRAPRLGAVLGQRAADVLAGTMLPEPSCTALIMPNV